MYFKEYFPDFKVTVLSSTGEVCKFHHNHNDILNIISIYDFKNKFSLQAHIDNLVSDFLWKSHNLDLMK